MISFPVAHRIDQGPSRMVHRIVSLDCGPFVSRVSEPELGVPEIAVCRVDFLNNELFPLRKTNDLASIQTILELLPHALSRPRGLFLL
jgi:hypothetical protein